MQTYIERGQPWLRPLRSHQELPCGAVGGMCAVPPASWGGRGSRTGRLGPMAVGPHLRRHSSAPSVQPAPSAVHQESPPPTGLALLGRGVHVATPQGHTLGRQPALAVLASPPAVTRLGVSLQGHWALRPPKCRHRASTSAAIPPPTPAPTTRWMEPVWEGAAPRPGGTTYKREGERGFFTNHLP